MASYTVLQDIEAEDHILGPLTLRQFIYAIIAVFFYYINFLVLTKSLAFLLIIFLPPALIFSFFAFPFGKDQPTEVWALAKIRFLFKSRVRIWNKDGINDLVTITVPKKEVKNLTDGLSQNEVKSRLKVLSNTLDSRGWAIKSINSSMLTTSSRVSDNSSRLVDLSTLPTSVPDEIISSNEDILDEDGNLEFHQINSLIDETQKKKRQQLLSMLQPSSSVPNPPETYSAYIPQSTVQDDLDETALSNQLSNVANQRSLSNANLHILKSSTPSSTTKPAELAQATPIIDDPKPLKPVIVNEAKNTLQNQKVFSGGSSELSIQSVQKEMAKSNLDDEVVIEIR